MASPGPSYSSSRRMSSHGGDESMIGPFKKLENIGKGSFAFVYRGIHVKHRSLVAIKSVQLYKLNNKKLKDNLKLEIDILSGLQHPHIVSLIDCEETPQHMNIVMEFCELGDLSQFIKKRASLASHPATADMMLKYPNAVEGGLNEVVVRHFTKQIASALEFLHSKNFVHRDLKPQNFLLNPSPLFYAKHKPETMPFTPSENSLIPATGIDSLPMLKVADFGFARFLPQTSLAETLCGSPLYMAPEILRYEKYDAKADLWSVGAVVHEMMVAKPPFRAANHVDLLRRIEKQDDRIKFPEGLVISTAMKTLIRSLLRRKPVERMGFEAFFDDPVIRSDIPGLVGEDRPKVSDSDHSITAKRDQRAVNKPDTRQPIAVPSARETQTELSRQATAEQNSARSTRERMTVGSAPTSRPAFRQSATTQPSSRRLSHTPIAEGEQQVVARRVSRPAITNHPTAPARPTNPTSAPMERRTSRNSPSPRSSMLKEHLEAQRNPYRAEDRAAQQSRDSTDQDMAFEREYVVVEKRTVEVNALADDILAGSPSVKSNSPQTAMVRRATTSGSPTAAGGAHSRAMQIAQNKHRPEAIHQRTGSYERRYGRIPGTVTSAISNALHAVALRSGVSLSPPMGLGKGASPPTGFAGFPSYPTAQSSMLMIGDGGQMVETKDRETRVLKSIESLAHRSDCVYWFADVKYKQLLPAPPSEEGLGIANKSGAEANADADDDLTVDATMAIAEEALVLYVKAVAILSKAMDMAGSWWSRRARGDGRVSPSNNTQVAIQMTSVVQWLRTRFNECIDKAEFAARKLVEAQRRLPADHQHHPNNRCSESGSSTTVGSAENIFLPSGITAEKLIYDRAVEMSRTAAINELVAEDLRGCERNFMTAIQLLQAILDTEEETSGKAATASKKDGQRDEAEDSLELEDRQDILKLIESMKVRVKSLRKKIEIQKAQRRTSTASGGATRHSTGSSPSTTSGTATPSAR